MGDKINKISGNTFGGDLVDGDKIVNNTGDNFNLGDGGIAIGRGSRMDNAKIVQQNAKTNEPIDLPTLARELEELRQELMLQAKDAEQVIDMGTIASAESEAKKGDESKTFEYLAKAGTWVLEVAKGIGVPIAVEALKRSMTP